MPRSFYSDKKVLVVDSGLFPFVAETLARDFQKVFYFSPWVTQYPEHRKALIGMNLAPNVDRIYELWNFVPSSDLVVFSDLFGADLAEKLKADGKSVWAPGSAELLELARWETHQWLKGKGQPVPDSVLIEGIDNLREYLVGKEDLWIKISVFRGDFETFHHEDYRLTSTWLDSLSIQLGPYKNHLDFIVEESFPGIEVGYDGYQVNGQFPKLALYGYEAKDAAYLGKVVPYAELPKCLSETNSLLSSRLKGGASFFSTEVRVAEDGTYFLNDPAVRAGSPPSESYSSMFNNWSEIIWNGAHDELVDPEVEYEYVAQLILTSNDARNRHWLPLYIEDDVRDFVKLRNKVVLPEGTFVANQEPDDQYVGSVIGMGNSLEKSISECMDHAKQIKALGLEYHEEAFGEIMSNIEKGKDRGISW